MSYMKRSAENLAEGAPESPTCYIDGARAVVRYSREMIFQGAPVSVKIRNLLADGDSNTKLRKNAGKYRTAGLSLSPHKQSGIGNTCPNASSGCAAACLDHQGMAAVWESIHWARVARTVAFYRQREWFIGRLSDEIRRRNAAAQRNGERLAVRLNVFSDIPWERIAPRLFSEHRDVRFYDYSKAPWRAGLLAPNYWVTFSRSETNEDDCLRVLADGGNVAAVFSAGGGVGRGAYRAQLPKTWNGFRVIDGDTTDLRFADPGGSGRRRAGLPGVVVGLRLKAHSQQERDQAIASRFAIA